jgi:hypothetical protein
MEKYDRKLSWGIAYVTRLIQRLCRKEQKASE